MALFQAFRAVRPAEGKAEKVAALPYDVVSREEAREIGEKNPYSFLHVDRAEMDLDPGIDLYDAKVYRKAKENLDRFQAEGTLIQDEKPNYYLYELIRKGKSQTGIVGVSSIDDYMNGVIKKHELTREDKEQDRIHHVDICDANTGPIFLTCRYPEELLVLMENWKNSHEPVYDFTSEDEITHRVWIVDEEEKIQKINRLFGEISSIYIADGHHRAASAVKVGQKRRKEHPDYTGKEEFNFFLSVVFPYDQLTILPYHRIVKDLKGMEPKAFIGSMKFNFELMAMPGFPCKPVEKHCFGLYVDGEWFHLKAYPDIYAKKDSVGQLDVSILQDKVLGPVLGIEDPRTDERICFMGGNHRLKDLAAVADEIGGAAFAMYPTSMEELMNIADEGKLMPPKSTWFEPKLRSGLFIHKLSD
ncbi:DUF1015 domain-containing protein [Ruminococcus sp. AM36-2AA]|nr:DUF1015 domain-containing protein [Ruminococcus sp. OF03-6AA]RGH54870.1 DUF1015 domain-containing protein [Ruminococcus sp. AM36-5]RGH62281.1 DUF1015 domain-containing protein [Ruminococcus sp. AM36-2AA]